MTEIGNLILLHAGIGFMVWCCMAVIRGRQAERTYDARMSSPLRFFLMPGRLVERAV